MPVIQNISIEQMKLARKARSADVFRRPHAGDISQAIVEGKKALDLMTEFSIVELNREVLEAPPAALVGGRYQISKNGPVPLRPNLSRRRVDGRLLWVEIDEGLVAVLDSIHDEMMMGLCRGSPPSSFADLTQVFSLLALLARNGFIRGIKGHVDKTIVDAKRFLRLHLTERCNLSCIHCYADSGPHAECNNELSPQQWINILSDFSFVGGAARSFYRW